MKNFIKRFIAWCREKTFLSYYTKFKVWLRSTTTGVMVDRAFRFFVITAVTTFFTNYIVGQEIIPVIQSSIGVATIALYDKVKNEWFAKVRDENEITQL